MRLSVSLPFSCPMNEAFHLADFGKSADNRWVVSIQAVAGQFMKLAADVADIIEGYEGGKDGCR